MTNLTQILTFGADVQRFGDGPIDIAFHRRRAAELRSQILRRAAKGVSMFVRATLDALADAHRADHGRRS